MTSHSRAGLTVPSVLMISTVTIGIALGSTASAEEKAQPTFAAVNKPPHKPLDLRAPDITHLYSSEQLNKILAASFIREDIEEVQVQGERGRAPTDTPTVWPGIAAPIWALLHPTQSWRIFMPLPPDQTQDLSYVRANATDAYVLEPAATPSPPAR